MDYEQANAVIAANIEAIKALVKATKLIADESGVYFSVYDLGSNLDDDNYDWQSSSVNC